MSPGKHYTFIIHGARAETAPVRELIDRVRDAGHAVDPRITRTPGDGVAFARDGARAGVDAVVAVGGDGTVNEVLNGLDGSDVALGVIPLGTANDFARQFAIPLDLEEAMAVIIGTAPQRIDTAMLSGRRFLNVSTAGVGAEATAETPPEAKEALGLLAYAITGLRKFAELEPTPARFRGPDFSLDCEFLVFAVGNGRVTGGGTEITPRARLDDGLLDLCIVEGIPRGEFARLVLQIRRGEHLDHPAVRYVQLPAVTVEGESSISVNVDGESLTTRRLVYAVRPGDLRIHLPRDVRTY